MRRSLIALASCGLAGLAVVGPAAAGKAPAPPSYRTYAASGTLGKGAGEPTLGVMPSTGDVLFQAGLQTLKVSGFDRRTGPTWSDVGPLWTSTVSFDPLLKTDPTTGRTFVTQLELACSNMAYTDDRGETWHTVPLGCGAGTMFDHQSMGVGPYVKGSRLDALSQHAYPNVVYYCAQDVVAASCAPSIDGGQTFLPASQVYTTADCRLSGIFGHVKAAPDGTVYLPPRACPDLVHGGNAMSVAVSEDNGLTWVVRRVPDSNVGDAGHGTLGVARDGTIYVAWGDRGKDGGGPVNVAVSHDKGRTWTKPFALGKDVKVANTRFPVAVAGDPDRAVVAYLGTPTAGKASDMTFKGTWHLYASHTYDGGRTWKTYDITPKEPVQVGSICTAGTTCGDDRNLLDFNDMVVDAKGRVYIAFADGCTKPSGCTTKDREARATVARLSGGRGVYRAYDGKL